MKVVGDPSLRTYTHSPNEWVELNQTLLNTTDRLKCPICHRNIDKSLATHVISSDDHLDLKSFKEEYDGIPLTTEGMSEKMSESRYKEIGIYDWRRLDADDDTILRNEDWIVSVEESELIAEPDIFDHLVELFNQYDTERWRSFRIGVATSLLIALNDEGYDFITGKEVADRLNVDERLVKRRKSDHPESTDDLRFPEDLVRIKLDDIGDVNLDDIREELLSYPDEFKYGGREARTIAALATWRAVDWISQDRASKIFGVTTVAIRNARDDLESRRR
jgi:hypothetical protein